jgi:superfamily II DNA/RNA helicase
MPRVSGSQPRVATSIRDLAERVFSAAKSNDAVAGAQQSLAEITLKTGTSERRDRWIEKAVDRAASVFFSQDSSHTERAVALRSILRLANDGLGIHLSISIEDEFATALRHSSIEWQPNADGSWCFTASPIQDALFETDPPELFDLRDEDRWAAVVAPELVDGVWRRYLPTEHYPTYRSSIQRIAVRALLLAPEQAVLMVSLPTGGGKSLCATIPAAHAMALQGSAHSGFALFIAPTVALLYDQANSLRATFGLAENDVLVLTGSTPPEARSRAFRAIREGNAAFVLMSPEMALGQAREPLQDAAKAKLLRTVIVDEAHLIASWGAAFRPDIQRFGRFRQDLARLNPQMRTVLLSGTVTPEAEQRLRRCFTGETDSWMHVDGRRLRTEHDYVAAYVLSPESRQDHLVHLLRHLPRPALVYATKVEHAAAIASRLKSEGFGRSALFTGDTVDAERRRIVRQWRDDDLDIVVATSAFGLGIDKPDLRVVIHAEMPESLDRFYQEVGRGGRDGFRCLSLSLIGPGDEAVARGLSLRSLLGPEKAAARWCAMIEQSRRVDSAGGEHVRSFDLDVQAPHVLEQNPVSGMKNRDWNEATLLLMERSGLISILTMPDPEEDTAHWLVELPEGAADLSKVDDVIRNLRPRRSFERTQLDDDLRRVAAAVASQPERCIAEHLADAYGLKWTPRCGRCGWCRAHSEGPGEWPITSFRSMNWNKQPASPRPLAHAVTAMGGAGRQGLVLCTDGGWSQQRLQSMIRRLAQAGIEQFLLAGDTAAQAFDAVFTEGADRLGMGLRCDVGALLQWNGDNVMECATALLAGPDWPHWTTSIVSQLGSAHARTAPWVWVAPSGVTLADLPDRTIDDHIPVSGRRSWEEFQEELER